VEEFTTGTNQRILIHDRSECEGVHCVYHNPSNHHMRDWRINQRLDSFSWPLVERLCSHGRGHPDPDSVAFLEKTGPEGARGSWGVHGCDGCCAREDSESVS